MLVVIGIEDFNTAQPKTLHVEMGQYVMLACDDNKSIHFGPTSFKWFFTTAKSTLTEILQDERKYIDHVGRWQNNIIFFLVIVRVMKYKLYRVL